MMDEDEVFDVLCTVPTRCIRILAVRYDLDATANIARLRYKLSEIEGILKDEVLSEWVQ